MGHDFKFPVVPLSEAVDHSRLDLADEAPIVLVVDDEPLIADTLAAILGQSGFVAYKAYNGASALEMAMQQPPNLLLTDVSMPGMNGIDLAMTVADALPACKVLLFSAHASTLDLNRSGAAGYNFPLLPKPLHPREMLRRVGELLFSAREPKTQRQVNDKPPAIRWQPAHVNG